MIAVMFTSATAQSVCSYSHQRLGCVSWSGEGDGRGIPYSERVQELWVWETCIDPAGYVVSTVIERDGVTDNQAKSQLAR